MKLFSNKENANAIAVDLDGNVYVGYTRSALSTNRIEKYAPDGTFLVSFGSQGSGDGQFEGVLDIETSADGRVYIVDSGNHRVQVFDSNGTFLYKFGMMGSGDGQLLSPGFLALDNIGNIYVTNFTLSFPKLQKFDNAGNFIAQIGIPISYGGVFNIGGQFSSIYDVEIDDIGNIYISDNTKAVVHRYDKNGNYVDYFGVLNNYGDEYLLGTMIPNYLAFDVNNNLYASEQYGRIQKFDNSKTSQGRLGSQNYSSAPLLGEFFSSEPITIHKPTGTAYVVQANIGKIYSFNISTMANSDGEFLNPMGITVNGSKIVVADAQSYRLQTFDKSGNFQSMFGDYNQTLGNFRSPNGLTLDNAGNIYVTDVKTNFVQKFLPNGTFLLGFGGDGTTSGKFDKPQGIALDGGGNMYVTDAGNHRVQKFLPNGNFLLEFGGLGNGNGQLNQPNGIFVDGSGNIYVVDTGNNRVQKFNSAGVYQSQFGSAGNGNGQFNNPSGIFVDNLNKVYVADSGNNRIQVFDNAGNYLTQFGSLGSGDGQFNNPTHVVVDATNLVYVSDTGNNRIQSFKVMNTFFVRQDGNDSNTGFGNTAALAKKTVQNAVNTALDGDKIIVVGGMGSFNESVNIGKTLDLGGINSPIIQNLSLNGMGKTITISSEVGVSQILKIQNGTLEANGNLILISDNNGTAMIDNAGGSLNGEITMQRYVKPYPERTTVQGYNYFSSPVSNAKISEFNDDVSLVLNPAYDFVSSYSGAFPNFFRYNENRVVSSPIASDVFEKGWESPATISENLVVMKGYILNLNSGTTIDIKGLPNSGDKNIQVSKGNASNSGFNLVGNPYPAPIDWDLVVADPSNASVIEAQNWRRVATGAYSGTFAYYVPNPAKTGTNSSTNEIASMQGFFVKANNVGNSTLAMKNSMRLTTYSDTRFFRTEESEQDKTCNGFLLLKVSDGKNADETIVYFSEKASEKLDRSMEAIKTNLNSAPAPNLFTKIGKEKMAIQALPKLRVETTVPLHFMAQNNGLFTFSPVKMSLFKGNPQILLEDRKQNKIIDLTQNTYSFSANQGLDSTRFVLRFAPDATYSFENEQNTLFVYPNPAQEKVNLYWLSEVKGEVSLQITDILGREVSKQTINKQYESIDTELTISSLDKGIYFVTLQYGENRIVKKLVKE